MSIGKKINPVGTTFTAPTNSLMSLSPAERQKLGMPPLNTLGNTNLMDFGQLNSNQQVPIGVAGVPEKVPATNIPKFSKFGNLLARMGGMNSKDIISQKDINNTKMTQEQMDNYSQQRNTARGKGMSDLLLALGTAFKGEDIIKTVGDARENRTLQEETARVTDLNNQMAQAYANGNFDEVRRLAIMKDDPSMNQSIFNNMNKDMSSVSPDGKLILERDKDGNIIGAKPNTSVIDAMDPKELSYSAIKDINEGETKISSMNNTSDEIDGFIDMIDNKELDFGFFEGIGDYISNEYTTSDQESRNSRAFENWKNNLVNKALQMQPGTKTDFDFVAIAQSLASANDPEGVKQFLLDYKKGLMQERKAQESGLDNIYELSGVNKPVSDENMTFVTKE